MLTKVDIKQRFDELNKKICSQNIASATEVLEYLTAVMRGEECEEKIFINNLGESETFRFKSQYNRLRAAELLAKRYRLLDRDNNADTIAVRIVDDMSNG